VTGGNTGIGKETIRVLLQKNAKVYMASRSPDKARQAIEELKQKTGHECNFLELDLANLDKVTKAAEAFKRQEKELHILFNSGGVMVPPVEKLTDDGYDLQFGTNVLGHAHFTLSLMPELIAGAKSSPDGKSRVVNVSSIATYRNTPPLIKWETLREHPSRRAEGTRALYAQSKYGNVAFSNELARRYGDQGVISNALNPGNIKTDLQRHLSVSRKAFFDAFILYPVSLGALTQLYVGTSPKTSGINGGWFIPWARDSTHSEKTRNPALEDDLWNWIEEQRKGH